MLKHLIVDAVIDEPLTINDCSSLANLTDLLMRTAATMDEFERLLTKAQSLVSLSLVCSNNECNDGNRWQQILSKMKLSKFNFLFFTDSSPAMDSWINPFQQKFWLERGWYIRYEQQKTNGYIHLYTIPYSAVSFLLDLTDNSTVLTTTTADAIEVFQSVRELVYIGCQTDLSNNKNYYFPRIETLILETDTLPPSTLMCFEHVKEIKLHTPLMPRMFNEVSMPALTRLVLQVLPTTWIIPYFNQRIRHLKLRTFISLPDEEVEAMCVSTSFVINCTHISLPVRSRQSIRLLLNRLIRLESVAFLCNERVTITDLDITENWIRNEISLRNFLFTTDRENERLGLWIGKSN